MLSDEQLLKVLQTLSGNNEKNEVIVRMSTILEHLNKSWVEERERVAVSISDIKKTAENAHVRINNLKDDINAYMNKFQGIVITINVLGFIVMAVINIYGKVS